jgi:putative membrane protein
MMGPGFGAMPGYMSGYQPWMMFGSLVFWALLAGLAVYLVVRLTRPSVKRTDARAILDERLARGEIDPEEYRSRLAVLGS